MAPEKALMINSVLIRIIKVEKVPVQVFVLEKRNNTSGI